MVNSLNCIIIIVTIFSNGIISLNRMKLSATLLFNLVFNHFFSHFSFSSIFSFRYIPFIHTKSHYLLSHHRSASLCFLPQNPMPFSLRIEKEFIFFWIGERTSKSQKRTKKTRNNFIRVLLETALKFEDKTCARFETAKNFI